MATPDPTRACQISIQLEPDAAAKYKRWCDNSRSARARRRAKAKNDAEDKDKGNSRLLAALARRNVGDYAQYYFPAHGVIVAQFTYSGTDFDADMRALVADARGWWTLAGDLFEHWRLDLDKVFNFEAVAQNVPCELVPWRSSTAASAV